MSSTPHRTLRERIYDELVEMILSGELKPGSTIDEKALTERMSVSRTPFREAIGMLANEGLVTIQPYRSFRVRTFTPKQVHDLYQVRRILERSAIGLAVNHISNADIDALERTLNDGIDALTRGDMQAYAERDREFHEKIAELSCNEVLVSMLAQLSLHIQMCRVVANQSPEFAARAAEERDAILGSLRARDAERASALMDAHIADVQQAVMSELSEMPANDTRPPSGAPGRSVRT